MADEGVVARALPAIQALAEMPAGPRLLWASSASGDYPVFVGRGCSLKGSGGRCRAGRFWSATGHLGAGEELALNVLGRGVRR